ncbi:hypothetical protein EDD15DRAFT_754390 [Pisolithus albus]|nr:hypothetical protein EDD15DRAFT_754390 [Pisolithus albus]
MHGLSSPCSGPSEASNPPQYSLKDLRSLLEDVIRVANVAKSLLRASQGLEEASSSCAQPPTDSASRSPRRTYSFCFFCGQKGHIRASCGSCKEYLAAGKCLIVKGRVVLPTGQEIPREIPGRTLKDRVDRWDPGNRPKDIRNPPSSPGRLPLEDVGRLEPQAHMVSLALSRTPRLSVHPTTPSEQPLCAPLSMEGPSYPTQAPSASSSSSDVSLCRPCSPSHPLPTRHSRGRPQSRSRSRGRGRPHSPSRFNLENPPSRSSKYVDSYSGSGSHSRHSHSRDYHGRLHSPSCSQLEDPPSHSNKYMDSYSSGSYSRCSRSRDYHHRCSPPPAPQLASSHLPTLSRDESELEELTSELVNRLAVSNIYSTRSSYRPSSHALASSRRPRSRSRTPQPSRRWY